MTSTFFIILCSIFRCRTEVGEDFSEDIVAGDFAEPVETLAAASQVDPREVPLDLVRQRLTDIGHIVPDKGH